MSKYYCAHMELLQNVLIKLWLKGHGHVTVNKPVISKIYIVAQTWPLCSAQILVDGLNPHKSYFKKSTNISAIVQYTSVSFVSLRSSRVHLQNNTFILRKVVEITVIWPITNTAKSSLRKKFVYITLRVPAPLNSVKCKDTFQIENNFKTVYLASFILSLCLPQCLQG